MRAREPRRRVMVRARMRLGARWEDVNILNMSSRGLLIQAPEAPPRGAYLEVRRGRHAIIATVVWSDERRFGVRTQDPLKIEEVISEPDRSAPEQRQPQKGAAPVERRRQRSRHDDRHDRSRFAARQFEFAGLVAGGLVLAYLAFDAVRTSLGAPLAEARLALRPE